jgi:hypothetical protein
MKYDLLVEIPPECGVVAIDRSGIILEFNAVRPPARQARGGHRGTVFEPFCRRPPVQGAERIFDRKAATMIGKNVSIIVPSPVRRLRPPPRRLPT